MAFFPDRAEVLQGDSENKQNSHLQNDQVKGLLF